MTFFAGKEVVNLPQVNAGDTVTVAYANIVKVRMAESGEEWDDSLAEVARATEAAIRGENGASGSAPGNSARPPA